MVIRIPGVDPITMQQIHNQTMKPAVQGAQRTKVTRDKEREKSQHEQREKLTKTVQKLNQAVAVLDSPLKFEMVERDGQWLVQIIDSTANRLLREVKPERVMEVVSKIQKTLGLLVDELI